MKLPALIRIGNLSDKAFVHLEGKLIGFFISNPEAITDRMKWLTMDEGACPVMVELEPADQFCKIVSAA